MIHLNYNSTELLTFYLKPSLSTPTYLLSLVNYTTRERKNFIVPDTSGVSDMLQFSVTEVGAGAENILTGNISIAAFGRYTLEVYEQVSSTNLDHTLATFLGDDKLITHNTPIYDYPPPRNILTDITGVVPSPMPPDAASPAAWWKFNDPTTLNSGSIVLNDPITTVEDKFGLGRDLEQLTAGLKPIYKTTHADFSGNKIIDVVNTEISKMSAWSVYVVCKPVGNNDALLGDGFASTVTVGMAISVSGSSKFRTFYGDDTNYRLTDSTTALTLVDMVYLSARFSTGSGPLVTQQINGADETEVNAGGTATSISGTKGTFRVGNRGGAGSSTDWNSDIQEIIIYDAEHSDADRDILDAYFASEYPSIGII